MERRALLIAAVLLGWLGCPGAARGHVAAPLPQPSGAPPVARTGQPGPQGPEEGPLRHQFWQVPPPAGGRAPLKATVYRPSGDGPFPLAVVSHGGTTDPARRRGLPLPHMIVVSEWLVARGFAVVVPQRRGYGDDPNAFAEDNGPCAGPDFHKAGLATAEDIRAAADFMRAQPFVDPRRVLLVGHSAGAFGSLALASTGYPGLIGVVNFGGGKGAFPKGDWRQNCAPHRLVEAMKAFGTTTAVPSLWIYAENDKFLPPDFARMMHEAYDAKRGMSTLIITPPHGDDGHGLVNRREARVLWTAAAAGFLDALR